VRWVAPTEKDAATDTLEKRLWAAADQLRANFYTVKLPCTLWFLDRGKKKPSHTEQMLFTVAEKVTSARPALFMDEWRVHDQ
jgi:hypothetical protein